ncbi:MBL fold metallo-hydrolase [Arthrobacter sulfonylureivorans]|uniref:MBL fold metallo-hydrolase n=1 Tax=Arthrobacter sulfonylureivorans TaxID=2486855 RepID=A0ABY3WE67_9MICC|nr:MBL fold metallo-hydrolase [Arthrobacter sulfonylureivorans]UNK47771.1 MBL fold metallo-hydrolase [Arthrobacter sulfonylureivorans]
MKVILLGTNGGPRPNPDRAAPANAVIIGSDIYVIDCGDGAARQLALAGHRAQDVKAIFVTHHHVDHTASLGSFPVLAWTDGRKDAMQVVGPAPTKSFVELSFEAFRTEIEARIATTGRADIRQNVEVTDIHEQAGIFQVYEDTNVRVTATLVDHKPLTPALAFRFDSDEGSVVFSGDTAYCPALIDLANGCDLLVHEAIHAQSLSLMNSGTNAPRFMDHMLSNHTTAADVGTVASLAGVQHLALTHLAPGTKSVTDEIWEEEVRKTYEGPLSIGRDLLTFEINASRTTPRTELQSIAMSGSSSGGR